MKNHNDKINLDYIESMKYINKFKSGLSKRRHSLNLQKPFAEYQKYCTKKYIENQSSKNSY